MIKPIKQKETIMNMTALRDIMNHMIKLASEADRAALALELPADVRNQISAIYASVVHTACEVAR